MKNVITAVIVVSAFIGMTNVALAQTASKEQVCETVEKVAKGIMNNRQSGVPLTDMMKVMNSPSAGKFGGLAKTLTIMAYEKPRYSSKEMQQKSVVDFANDAMLICLKTK